VCFLHRKKLSVLLNVVCDPECYKTATKPHSDPVQSSLKLGILLTEDSFVIMPYYFALFGITVLHG
jgi:hypothetical protein